MGNEECSMGFFLKLLPSAAIINGEKNRNAARRNKVFQREVNVTFGILPQIQKAALTKGLTLAIPEIVYGSHDTKVRIFYTLDKLPVLWQLIFTLNMKCYLVGHQNYYLHFSKKHA